MAAQTFLTLLNGIIKQVTAAVVGGVGSANLVPALNAQGQLDPTMMPPGIGADTVVVLASEAIAAGALVNLWNNGGTQNVRNADQTSPAKFVSGYAPAAIASAASGTIYLNPSVITGLTGLTVDAVYFLGTVGATTTTPPTAAGSISQVVGQALSATTLQFAPQPQIQL